MKKGKIKLMLTMAVLLASLIILPQEVYAYADVAPSPGVLGLSALIIFGVIVLVVCLIVVLIIVLSKKKNDTYKHR